MSALGMMATTLWTELVKAMQADGLLATSIHQSGPATTKVIVDACQAALPVETRGPWIKPHIKPVPGKEVVALRVTGQLIVVAWNATPDAGGHCWWVDDGGGCYHDGAFVAYTFVNTDGVPQ